MSHRSKRIYLLVFCAFVVIAFLGAMKSLTAQSTLAILEGAIFDETGSYLPGATVSLRNIESGYFYSGISKSNGAYIISGIQPGKYDCEVNLDGFSTVKRQGLNFTIGSRVEIDFQLTAETLEEEITVIADAPLVEVTKSEISSVVTSRDLDDLPISDRDYVRLGFIKPGVQVDIGYSGDYSIRSNAMPDGGGGFLIDGVSNENILNNTAQVSLPADAIQEFRVLAHQFAAEYGNAAGSVMSAISKSGSNQFGGRIYAFNRDEAFDSVPYFTKYRGYQGEERTKDEIDALTEDYTDLRLGGFLGGPIIKDKMHFFTSYEYHKYQDYQTIRTALIPEQTVEQPNIHPAFLFKLNYQLNEKNSFSMRYVMDRRSQDNILGSRNSPETGYDSVSRTHAFQVSWINYSSDRSMNELRIYYSNYKRAMGEDVDPTIPAISRPAGSFGRVGSLPQVYKEPRYQIVDNFSLFLGDHHFKFGVDFSYIAANMNKNTGVNYNFRTDTAFDPHDPSTYPYYATYSNAPPNWSGDTVNAGIFVQDSWKIHPQFTLNYGIRINWFKMEHLNIDNGNINNLNPRIGFSWDPVGDGKTAVRGGIGTFTLNHSLYEMLYSQSSGYEIKEYWPGYPDLSTPNPFTILYPDQYSNFITPQTEYIFNKVKNPYTLQTTLGIQREILPELSASVDLVYARGYDLMSYDDLNPVIVGTTVIRPDMTKGPVWKANNDRKSEYKALYVNLNKRFSKGWGFEITYTLSKSLADTHYRNEFPSSYEENRWELAWGPTSTDRRHKVAASIIANLPFGFQLSGILNYMSADPWTPYYLFDVNEDGLSGRDYMETRGSRRGFDYFSSDARISNSIRIGGILVQPFVEMYNLTNRTNFRTIFSRGPHPIFGQPLAAYPQRLIQLGLRVNF